MLVLAVTGSLIVPRRQLTAAWTPGPGEAGSWKLRALHWTVDLHDNLLMGIGGRRLNGLLALATLFVLVTGVALWWPRRGRWRAALVLHPSPSRLSLLSQLHRLAGIWALPLLLLWTLSAVYMAYPDPFTEVVGFFAPPDSDRYSPTEAFLGMFASLHFGRIGGPWMVATWIVLGLAPVLLVVTGVWQWWLRRR